MACRWWNSLTRAARCARTVWAQPGCADGSVTVHLGYGRTKAGRAGTGAGFNPYGLRTAKALWNDTGLAAKKDRRIYLLATTQNEHALDPNGHIVRAGDLADYLKNRRQCTKALRSTTSPDDLSWLELPGPRLGHGHRSERLHRMQRVRGSVPGGKQHRGGGQRPGAARDAPCIGCAWIPITADRRTTPKYTTSRCRASSAKTLPVS